MSYLNSVSRFRFKIFLKQFKTTNNNKKVGSKIRLRVGEWESLRARLYERVTNSNIPDQLFLWQHFWQ